MQLSAHHVRAALDRLLKGAHVIGARCEEQLSVSLFDEPLLFEFRNASISEGLRRCRVD
jgi:hypothetical protein